MTSFAGAGGHRRGRCLAACGLGALLALPALAVQDAQPAARPTLEPTTREVIFGAFDLAGWLRHGSLTVTTPHGDGAKLFDGDPSAVVGAVGPPPLRITLAFDHPQVVRQVFVFIRGTGTLRLHRDEGGDPIEKDVLLDDEVSFALDDVACQRLSLEAVPAKPGDPMWVREVEVRGRMELRSLHLREVPAVLPEGGQFPLVVWGDDGRGGRWDISHRAQLQVTPRRAVARTGRYQAEARAGGAITLVPRLGALQGPPVLLTVQPLGRAPAAPVLRSGLTSVELALEGSPPFDVFRRVAGEREALRLGRTVTQRFLDDGLAPATAYHYSLQGTDRFGNARTPRGAEARVRTLAVPPPGHADPGRLPVLVALFVDTLEEGEAEAITESLEAARAFVYRHSLGRCVLELSPLPLPGPTPAVSGLTMGGVERLLRDHGLEDDSFGVVMAIANDLPGNFAGFGLLGRAVGAMGRDAQVPTPKGALGPDPAAAWSFVHELQHVIGRNLAREVGLRDQPSGHFAQDWPVLRGGNSRHRPLDTGEAWAGQAALFRRFEGFARIPPPWRRALETLDGDGDGLPDDDERFPIDEKRLGTDPSRADTDGDGLSDMQELAAGLYAGSDPLDPDSDGDGQPDGADPWPLDDFTGTIPRGSLPQRLWRATARHGLPGLQLDACWEPHALTLVVTASEAWDVYLDLDGSGRLGRWESDVNLGTAEAPASDVWCGPARLALRAHEQPLGVFRGGVLVPDARVTCSEDGSGHRLTVVLPVRLGPGAEDVWVPANAPRVPGLRLQAGSVLGLALTLRPAEADAVRPFEAHVPGSGWSSLFETHLLLDAELVDAGPR